MVVRWGRECGSVAGRVINLNNAQVQLPAPPRIIVKCYT
jgi:hypothetical protein